jgi:hypothetical protein
MATIAQDDLVREEVKGNLNFLNEIEITSLVKKEELGDMSFESGLPVFERTLRLYRDLSKIELGTISTSILNQIRDRSREAKETFTQIKEFSFKKYPSNTQAQRDSLITSVQDRYDTEFMQISPVIAYGIRLGTDFTRLEREAKEKLSTMNTLLQEQEKSKEETAKSVHDTLEEVRKLAREAGVSQHAEIFSLEATEHGIAAGRWLVATICVAATAVVVSASLLLLSWFFTPNDITTTKAVQIGIAKVAILSLLFSALLWVGRIYRSQRHNYVVNRHRMNALRTFQTFANATGDDATRNAVLIQATQCIFGAQPTGYISTESDSNPASQILEIVRTAGKSS